MDGNRIMKSLGGMEVYDEAVRKYVNGITTAGTGAAYTATVKAIDTLVIGANFVMVPHVTSTTTAPTINVNGLGAKNIRMRISTAPQSTIQLTNAGFLVANKPVRLVYDGQYWIVDDMVQPNANGLYGTVPVASGGTGCTTLADAKKLFSVADDTGVIQVSSGGTGAKTAADARTNLGITLANIGAAASSHKHDASDITSGALAIEHGGTGATNAKAALNNLGIRWGKDKAEDSGTPNTIYIQLLD